jgi:hypothetical protein
LVTAGHLLVLRQRPGWGAAWQRLAAIIKLFLKKLQLESQRLCAAHSDQGEHWQTAIFIPG